MSKRKEIPVILLAEDDADDRMMIEEAAREVHLAGQLRFVEDGDELMDYLYKRGHYGNSRQAPRPGVILLDLNMPRKDGRQALREIKSDSDLRTIPVIVLTTSNSEQDIFCSYKNGANAYITKPSSFSGFVDILRVIKQYWFEVVTLPFSLLL